MLSRIPTSTMERSRSPARSCGRSPSTSPGKSPGRSALPVPSKTLHQSPGKSPTRTAPSKHIGQASSTSTGMSPKASPLPGVRYINEEMIKRIAKQDNLAAITTLNLNLTREGSKKIRYIENLERLKKLQVLNLSCNTIEKIEKLEKLTELRELNLSHNRLTKIENIETLVKLQVLNLTDNCIEHIPVWLGKKLRALRIVKLDRNKIESTEDFAKLRPLKDLCQLTAAENPVSRLPHYRSFLIFHLRTVDILDGQDVSIQERNAADARFAQEELDRLEQRLERAQSEILKLKEQNNTSLNEMQAKELLSKEAKSKLKQQDEAVRDLRRELDTRNNLLKRKTSELTKACEKHYELEQELAFYKIDHKFEALSKPAVAAYDEDDLSNDEGLIGESPYLGKGRFKQNQLARQSQQAAAQPQQAGVSPGGARHPGHGGHTGATPGEAHHPGAPGIPLPQTGGSAKVDAGGGDGSLDHDPEARVRLQQDLEMAAARLSEKHRAIEGAQDKLQVLHKEISAAERQLQQATEELQHVAGAPRGRSLTEDDKQHIRSSLSTKINKVHDLQGDARAVEGEIDRAEVIIERQEEEIGTLRARLRRVDSKDALHSAMRREVADKERQLDLTTRQHQDLQGQLGHVLATIAKKTEGIQRLEQELREGQASHNEAVKDELESVIGGLQGYLAEVQHKAEQQRLESEALCRERGELLDRIQEMESDREMLEEQAEELSILKEKLSELEECLHEERDLNESLQQRMDESRVRDDERDTSVAAQLREAQEQADTMARTLREADRRHQEEREALRREMEAEHKKVDHLKAKARDSNMKEGEIRNLHQELTSLQTSNAGLQDQVYALQKRLEEEKHSSVHPDDLRRRLDDVTRALRAGRDQADAGRGRPAPGEPQDEVDVVLADMREKVSRELEKGAREAKQAKRERDKVAAELTVMKDQVVQVQEREREMAECAIQTMMDEEKREADRLNSQLEKLRAELEKEREANRRRQAIPTRLLEPSSLRDTSFGASSKSVATSGTVQTATSGRSGYSERGSSEGVSSEGGSSETETESGSSEFSTVRSSQWSSKRRQIYENMSPEEQELFDELQREIEALRGLLGRGKGKEAVKKASQAAQTAAMLRDMISSREGRGRLDSHPAGHATGHPTGHPASHATGRPTGRPTGHPTGHPLSGGKGGATQTGRPRTGKSTHNDDSLGLVMGELDGARQEIERLQTQLRARTKQVRAEMVDKDRSQHHAAARQQEIECLHDVLGEQKEEIDHLTQVLDRLNGGLQYGDTRRQDPYVSVPRPMEEGRYLAADHGDRRGLKDPYVPRMTQDVRHSVPDHGGPHGLPYGPAGPQSVVPGGARVPAANTPRGRPLPTFYDPAGHALPATGSTPGGVTGLSRDPHAPREGPVYTAPPAPGVVVEPGFGPYSRDQQPVGELYGPHQGGLHQGGPGPHQGGPSPHHHGGHFQGGPLPAPLLHPAAVSAPSQSAALQPYDLGGVPTGGAATFPAGGAHIGHGHGHGHSASVLHQGAAPPMMMTSHPLGAPQALGDAMGTHHTLPPDPALWAPGMPGGTPGGGVPGGGGLPTTPIAGPAMSAMVAMPTTPTSYGRAQPIMMSTPNGRAADGSPLKARLKGILKKGASLDGHIDASLVGELEGEGGMVCSVPEHHDLEDYIAKMQQKIRSLKSRLRDHGEASTMDDNRQVLFEDDVERNAVKRLQAELNERRGELEGLDLAIERQKGALRGMKNQEGALQAARQAARRELGQLRSGQARRRAFLDGSDESELYDSDYDYEYSPRAGRQDRKSFLQEEVACLEETLAKRRAELRAADRLLEECQLDLGRAKEQAQETLVELRGARAELAETREAAEGLQERARQAGLEVLAAQEQTRHCQEEADGLRARAEDHGKVLLDVQEVIAAKDAEFQNTDAKLKDTLQRLQQVTDELQATQLKQSQHMNALKDSDKVIAERRRELEELVKQVGGHRRELEGVERRLGRGRAELELIQGAWSKRRSQLDALDQDVASDIHQKKIDLESVDDQLNSLQAERRRLEQDMQQQEDDLEKLRSEAQGKGCEIERLRHLASEEEGELESLRGARSSLEATVTGLGREKDSLERGNRSLQERITDLRRSQEEVETNITENQRKLTRLQRQMDRVRAALDEAERHLANGTGSLDDADSDLLTDQDSNDNQDAEEGTLGALEEKAKRLVKKICELTNERTKMATNLERTTEELQTLRNQTAQNESRWRDEAEKLKNKVSGQQQLLQQRNQEVLTLRQKSANEVAALESIAQAHCNRANRLGDELSYVRAEFMELRRQLDCQQEIAERDKKLEDTIRDLKDDIKMEMTGSSFQKQMEDSENKSQVEDVSLQRTLLQDQLNALKLSLAKVRGTSSSGDLPPAGVSRNGIHNASDDLKTSFLEHQGFLKNQLRQKMRRQSELMQSQRQMSQDSILKLQRKLANLETVLSRQEPVRLTTDGATSLQLEAAPEVKLQSVAVDPATSSDESDYVSRREVGRAGSPMPSTRDKDTPKRAYSPHRHSVSRATRQARADARDTQTT